MTNLNPNRLFVEFTGTPESGKTTIIDELLQRYNDNSDNIVKIREAAEILPEDLKNAGWLGNVWMRMRAIQDIIIAKEGKAELTLIDRGIYDGLFWADMFKNDGRCTEEEYEAYIRYVKSLKIEPDLMIVFYTTPEESIKRRGGEGRIVTFEFVRKYNEILERFYRTKISTEKYWIDTTNITVNEVVSRVIKCINYKKKFG